MGPLDLTLHLLGFAAPAFFVALFVVFSARWLRIGAQPTRWWACAAINFTTGLMALAAGLWAFGIDGKMATYAALVTVVASTQWFAARAWK